MQSLTSKSPLYDKRIAGGLSTIFELIVDVFTHFEDLTWSTKKQEEFGFYEKDKVTKSDIFCGIWFESWIHFEIPLCIAFDYQGNAPVEKYQQLKTFIEKKNIKGLIFRDYNGFALVLFDSDFFNFEDDMARVKHLFLEISTFVGMNNRL